jgi:hypothetical protein
MLFVGVQYVVGASPLYKVASVRYPVKDSTDINDAIALAKSLFSLSYASVKEVSLIAVQDVKGDDALPPQGAFLSCIVPVFIQDVGSFSITIPYPKQSKTAEDILTVLSSTSNLKGEFLTPYFKIA